MGVGKFFGTHVSDLGSLSLSYHKRDKIYLVPMIKWYDICIVSVGVILSMASHIFILMTIFEERHFVLKNYHMLLLITVDTHWLIHNKFCWNSNGSISEMPLKLFLAKLLQSGSRRYEKIPLSLWYSIIPCMWSGNLKRTEASWFQITERFLHLI